MNKFCFILSKLSVSMSGMLSLYYMYMIYLNIPDPTKLFYYNILYFNNFVAIVTK